MNKFNPGDRIHTTAPLSLSVDESIPVGSTGTLTEYGSTFAHVVIDGYESYFGDDEDRFFCYLDSELGLITEPQPYDMPSPEVDALDRIADALRPVVDFPYKEGSGTIDEQVTEWRKNRSCAVEDIIDILRETGRL